ncbi:histidine phosphatase family protein [Rhodoflexus caldus]|uniref:histidine phosphatase family protein n=1 Tax=Rhodoflexus caldus TaxID=2891236 RepID=UPI00202AB167|nr:histidine phosphatase family protein [Rhodoflexus caldus]
MATKELYIIRHGETEFNKRGFVQGSGIDSNLNDTGRRQAQAFFEHYRHVNFDKIYVSALKRTWQSVEPFFLRGVPMQVLPGLNEISWGHKEGKVLSNEDDLQYFDMLNSWRSGDLTVKVPGGESPLEVAERQKVAIRHIMQFTHEERVLVCMHGRAMRIILSLLLETPMTEMDKYDHGNLCLYVLHHDGEKFHLKIANSTEHFVHLPPAISNDKPHDFHAHKVIS